MKPRGVRARFLVPLVLVAASGIFMASPSLRSKGYFVLFRAWYRHCPWKARKPWPFALWRVFEPLVPVWVEVEPGVTMRLDPYDFVDRVILVTGEWESQTWQTLKPHLPAGGTFVDVGAHIGWYSLKAAKAVGPRGRVIAVEPDRTTLLSLRDNIRASGDEAIILVAPVACSDSETTLTFFEAPRANTGESSLSFANAAQEGGIANSYPVRARPLDDILKEAGVTRVDAVKIDVEGAEFLVLKGAVETLRRYRPVVAVELAEKGLESMGSSVEEVKSFMASHGYTLRQITESNAEFVPIAKPAH